jgi:flagellar protein FlaG
MVGTVDPLSSVPAPTLPESGKDPTAPSDTPDLRDTQAAVQVAAKSAQADGQSQSKDGTEKDLENAINERVAKLLRSNIRMSVELDEGTGDFVYKSIDKKTGEVDRQWPAESILRMLAFFRELDGLIYDKKA